MPLSASVAAFVLALSHPAAPAKPVFKDGQSQIVDAFNTPADWIRQSLWVETEFDSDKDGKKDRVHVDVTRQKQTETEGLKVPVIYESSPYFAGTGDGRSILWDVHQELGATPPPRTTHPNIEFDPNRNLISNDFVMAWVPRGFAVVHSEAPGTGLSTGSPTVGGAPERLAPKAVIDWLNGRAKGFTTADGTTQTYAKWCTGKVGMTGTSYNGTIPVAAATTGVKGLECIIPVAPNTSYYHYYRSNGLVRHPGGWLGEDIDSLYDFINSGNPANRERSNKLYRDGEFAKNQDRQTGDYNAFWADRDLLRFAKNIKCAVLMAHAFNDWNVVPEHSVRISEAVKGRVPLVQYFHQGGHGGEPPFELMNKWFTRFLYRVKNGVESGPKAYIVREREPGTPRGTTIAPTPYADYPNPEAKSIAFYLSPGGQKAGALNLAPVVDPGQETLTDDVNIDAPTLAKADESPNRLIYVTPELSAPLHLSGTARITLRLASSVPAANLSVYLVQLPWTDGPIGTANLITRGWADPQNARELKGGDYHSLERGAPLRPGEFVSLTFDLQPDDQIIPAGKKIALMILSSDHDFTLYPAPGAKLTVDLAATKITLPVVGGLTTYKRATAGS
ncbi:MAG: Xaa-Pro dipeptidyl-peptidase [Armatimonadetes bacterium 55-13]|nr:Xaa-Pro dipeptidyl-peptidase [Armatimonadota bacterium]OJU65624.1 MAG: Xaa-Pro dipeptidyl-peptidase [Armatimonadetes bacterium 55-13]